MQTSQSQAFEFIYGNWEVLKRKLRDVADPTPQLRPGAFGGVPLGRRDVSIPPSLASVSTVAGRSSATTYSAGTP
jgi:hypothetical protein